MSISCDGYMVNKNNSCANAVLLICCEEIRVLRGELPDSCGNNKDNTVHRLNIRPKICNAFLTLRFVYSCPEKDLLIIK